MSAGAKRLTAEQREALEVRGASVALSAGAGCGKTTVLTERYLGLLEGPDRRSVGEIVALTFTEKAARELRERVRRESRQRLDSGADTPLWRTILRDLEAARIGTFHAFCATILKKYAIEAGLDPAFEVLDDAIAPLVRDEAMSLCLRRWLASQNPDFQALAIDVGLGRVEDALTEILANRPDLDFAEWSRRAPEDVVASWERFRDQAVGPAILRRLQGDHRELLETLLTNECSHPTGNARRGVVLAALPALHESLDPLASLRDLRENAKVVGGGTKRHWPSEDIYERVKDGYEALREGIDKALVLFEPDDGQSLPAAEAGLRFARLALEVIDQYAEGKKGRGMVDFFDLQNHVQTLLRVGPERVRDELRRSIGVLLVDEFQDTDPVQAEILDLLAGPDAGAGRLFLVGDVKQSIYGFRGAEPAIFGTYRDRFPAAGRLNLTENFRSVPGVLAFVNALFADHFSGVEHALKPGGNPPALPVDRPAVEFLWEPGGGGDAQTRRKAEAAAIARLLARRLAEGWPVRDPSGGPIRSAAPGDVALLFRSRSDFPLYEQALANEGLDYHLVGGGTYFAQQEVIDLINLLSTIEDPMDALALAGTLRGPFFGLSDEGLFWLATARPGELPLSFANDEGVMATLDEDDRAALARARALLSRWRGWKDRMPVATLLDRCLDESGFEAALLGEFLGDRKRANVRKLVHLARRFDDRGGLGLADFVARLRADLKNPPREEQATTTDEHGQAVRLMTIHQAKGLEFPIVVLPDLERRSPPESKTITWHPGLGLLVRAGSDDEEDDDRSRSLGIALLKADRKRAEDEESLRILYVGATRARDFLILSASRAPNEPARQPATRLLASRFDLATGNVLAPDSTDARGPLVGLVPASSSESARTSRRPGHRPKLLLTARRIAESVSLADPPPPDDAPRPAFRDLDPPAAAGSRVERMARAVVADPGWPREPVDSVISRVAKARGEWLAGRDRESVRSFLDDQGCAALRERVAGADETRGALRWTLCWPLDGPSPSAYRGRIDRAFRMSSGEWELLNLIAGGDPEAGARERLNLVLSAYAADALGCGPVASAWLVTLRPESVAVDRVVRFDAGAVERLIREVIYPL